MKAPRLCWYGDDFTGATDTLGVLAQAGQRAMLFMGVPTAAHREAAVSALGGALDAVGIAGASRAMDPASMEAALDPVGAFLASLGAPVMHYKVCSTFDSAPHVGNIATAVNTLRRHVHNPFVPVVGGQPGLGRYCAFSNLFAAAGSGAVVERIDRHPTMCRHPVTPMHEADLRRHLSALGLRTVSAVHYPVYGLPFAAQQDLLNGALACLPDVVILDVALPEHLAHVGRLIWTQARRQPLLAVGPSSVAQALVAWWRHEIDKAPAVMRATPLGRAEAPVFVFAGSLSPVTARQIQASPSYERIAVSHEDLLGDISSLISHVVKALRSGHHVLAYTAPEQPHQADTSRADAMAWASARLVRDVLREQAAAGLPLRRVGIAGGDTSSRAVEALAPWGLSYRAALDAGVTVSRTHSDEPARDGIELMLKGGQMGGADVFERLITGP